MSEQLVITLRPDTHSLRSNKWVGAVLGMGFVRGFKVYEDELGVPPLVAAERELDKLGVQVAGWVQVGPGWAATTDENTLGPRMPTPTIDYTYHWAFGEGPVGVSVHDDKTKVSITHVVITEFPGSNEPSMVRAEGRAMTKLGGKDGRYSHMLLCWADDDALLRAHHTWKAVQS